MVEYNVQLRGWQALVAIPVLLGFWGVEMYLHVQSVDDAMRDAVRAELLNEYSGEQHVNSLKPSMTKFGRFWKSRLDSWT